MTPRRYSLVLVVGLSFTALGIANTTMGWRKMDEYREKRLAAVAAGGESVKAPFEGTRSILAPSTDAQLLYEGADLKYQYYRIVRRGGFWFLGIGATLVLAAVLRAVLRGRDPLAE